MDEPQRQFIARIRKLRARFAAAHGDGMASLARRDFAGFGQAIRREREILREQQRLLDAYNSAMADEYSSPLANATTTHSKRR